MLNSVSKTHSKDLSGLTDILSPVSSELMLLEEKLIRDLSCNNDVLNGIVKYIIQAGGKRLRPAISFLFAKALNKGYVSANHFGLGQAVELIHTATLIHDDVIDGTEIRRKRQTVNKIWSNQTAIIAGDFLLAKSLDKLASVKNFSVIEIFAKIMGEMCEGEIQQNLNYYHLISLEQYIDKSRKKTANLFAAGAESAAILTPDADNLTVKAAREYTLNFGIAFQIVDDILNFTAAEEELGKPIGVDLQDGILTAPVLFALEEYEKKNNSTLKSLIETEFENKDDFKKAVDLVFDTNGIQRAKELAKSYAKMAIESLSIIEDSSSKESLVKLANYVVDRKY